MNPKMSSFFIGKLHMHSVGLEHTTSPSTLLQRKEVPFELNLIVKPQNVKYQITYFQLKQNV